jgi:hypothetical protein
MIEKEITVPTKEDVEAVPEEIRPIKLTWIKDTKGRQGEVLFDGKIYWITQIDKESGRVLSVPFTQAEWLERNKELTERKITK